MASTMMKPTFDRDQLISATEASKKFGDLTKKAKLRPLYVTKDGNVDTVIIGYELFEEMYERLMQFEQEEEERVLLSRLERLERDPSIAVPWKTVRRRGK